MSERSVCERCGTAATVQVTDVESGVARVRNYCDEHVPGVVMPTALARQTRALISKLEHGPHRHPEAIAKLRSVLGDLATTLEKTKRQ